MPDFVDRIVDFLVEEHHQRKLTDIQVERLRGMFLEEPQPDPRDSSTATTVKMPIHAAEE